MKRKFTKLIAALALLVFMTPTMVGWGQTTVDVTLSSGSFYNNEITWTCADGNITIQQLKGSGSSNPSSNYISAPRVYKQNILSFVGTNGYTITNIAIKCDGSYYGTTKYAGTVISENNVENNTTALNPTWSTTNGGTHNIATVSSDGLSEIYIQNGHSSDANTQLRITKLTITYKVSGNITATTVTINTDNLTNTDVYVSTAAGSLTASVTETESGDAVSDASVTWTSSDTGVATIDEDGEVTLVAVGTTTITASYAGGSGYGSSSATYALTVTSSEPYVQPTTIEITPNYTFWGKSGQFSGSTYSELSGEQDNVTLYWTRGSGSTYANLTAMRFYKDNTLTFTAPEGYEIESIVITMASGYAQNDITFSPGNYSLSGTTGTWNGSSETVTMTRPSNADSYAQISNFTITIALPKVLSSIALSGDYPTTFHVGDAFSHEGMTVTATYDDESTKDVTDDATFSGYDMSTSGNQTVTVSYTEDEVTKTATYGITVNAPATLASITLSGTYPTEFTQGDAFSHEGMTVTATYDDESTKDVTANATFSGYDMSTIGNQTVTVSYTENEVTKTATYGITVNEYVQPTEIEIDLNNTFFGCAAFTTWSSSCGTSFNGTESGVTITLDKGTSQNMYINTNGIRMYDGNTLTFDAPDGYNIVQIALEGAEGFSANLEADGLNEGTWTGSATQVEITGNTNKKNMTKATITLAPISTEPAITVESTTIEATAEDFQGTLNVTYTAIESYDISWFESDGTTATTEPEWISTDFDEIGNIEYLIDANEGEARTAYFKVYGLDGEMSYVYSELVTISQAGVPQQYTLTVEPFENLELITYVNDEVEMESDGTTSVTEGAQVKLSIVAEEGYVIATLMVNGVDHAGDIEEGAYSFEMPAEDVTISATAEEAPTPVTYNLATSIVSGKTYIISNGSNGNERAMGAQNGNVRSAAAITIDNNVASVTSADVYEFVITGSAEDGYTIYDVKDEGYLYASSSNNNNIGTRNENSDDNSMWTIDFDESAVTITAKGTNTRNIIRYNYNNGNERFSCYASTSSLQDPLYLFVKDEAPATETYTLEINGYTDVVEGPNNQGYYLIASPVTVDPENVDGMTDGDFDLYSFNQSEAGAEWQNYETNPFNFVPGTGYLYAKKATNENQEYSFTLTGEPYNSDGVIELVYDEENADPDILGWNLVGNPFSTNATVDKDIYIMNEEGSGIVPAGANQTMIVPMQGIFVKATEEGQYVTFTQVDEGATNNNLSSLSINLSNNASRSASVIDRAIVRFNNGNTLPKFQLFENSTKLYIPQNGEDYAIVSAEAQGEMPVNFKAAKDGQYTITINSENVEMSYLHLIDNIAGQDIDLLQTPSYTFEARRSDYASRFRLVFSANNVNENDNENENTEFAFISDGNIIISGAQNATVQVVDMLGRVVVSRNSVNTLSTEGIVPGVYVIRVIDGENVRAQKIVVR